MNITQCSQSKTAFQTVTSEGARYHNLWFCDWYIDYRGIDAFVCQIVELIDSEPYIFVPQLTQGMKDNSLGHSLEWV